MYTQNIYKMADIFEHTIICKKCSKKMQQVIILKNGFKLRALICPSCKEKIIHPKDIEEYNTFSKLKRKDFKVKLRLVGNSYTVSIPKEIVRFIREQERVMNDIVKLCFEEAGKLSLFFEDENY